MLKSLRLAITSPARLKTHSMLVSGRHGMSVSGWHGVSQLVAWYDGTVSGMVCQSVGGMACRSVIGIVC